MLHHPPFGQADLTNCERELIHLAASIQPHGALLVLREPELTVQQASENCEAMLGMPVERLLGRQVGALGGDVQARLAALAAESDLAEPVPLQCRIAWGRGQRMFEGEVHRAPGGALIVELEPLARAAGAPVAVELEPALLQQRLGAAVQRFSGAASIAVLADAAVQVVRDLTGFDRVMVYKFDPDGHGKIIAEARDPRLDSLLGHHYPASDIPQRARELYLRNRVRVLVDASYAPVPLQPRTSADGAELDMSMCALRSMSPLHIQYLKNMGVTATLVVSLVREGRLWGLVAAHHYAPRNLGQSMRSACALLGEVISTRIAAIENYAHAQVAILVRRLEQRLVEATSIEGDWRLALFRNPRTLLQPLEATGAALFHDGDVLTSGEVPSTPELRALLQWVEAQPALAAAPFACSSVVRANPALDSLTPVASGVMAVKLSSSRPDWLMWFRKEQLLTVTWAGDPTKPMVGDDPLELSPRRSFAAWSELVRGTALPWSNAEVALARAIGAALVDIILQVHAVRLLIAEHQLAQTRATVESSQEPVLIADAAGRVLFANAAFRRLTAAAERALPATLSELAERFTQAQAARSAFAELTGAQRPWRGELTLASGPEGGAVPVMARAEIVPGRDGSVLGAMLILIDRSDTQRAQQAREHLERSLTRAAQLGTRAIGSAAPPPGPVIDAILANASLAAMDIADASSATPVAPLLEELEASTQRAARLYAQIRALAGER